MAVWQFMLLFVFVIIGYLISAYNKGITHRNYVREAFATMDVYLKKRWDLVPNLIELVKNYTQYEKSILKELTEIRTRDYQGLSAEDKIDTNMVLGQTLTKFVAVAENYPDLKANQTYTTLMQQLENVENDIANARKYYNGTVREYNTFLDVFPTNIIGEMFGFRREKLFIAEENERTNIKVEL
ncbi:MAG: LemA family protein [Alphaproteobacteria bacterium]